MELELKPQHIQPYVIHGLKAKHITDVNLRPEFGEDVEIDGLQLRPVTEHSSFWSVQFGNRVCSLRFVVPLLRPLFQLTQEITHNGEAFVPADYFHDNGHTIEFAEHGDGWYFEDEVNPSAPFDFLPVYVWSKLIEWHFDVFGLLENNLAIEKPAH
ncbi:MAG: hypothetical protein GQ553_03475 [Nitrosomonadaceae bacterium]|nr:hypothetical protein [Nitrosomonadaceae bacterium]